MQSLKRSASWVWSGFIGYSVNRHLYESDGCRFFKDRSLLVETNDAYDGLKRIYRVIKHWGNHAWLYHWPFWDSYRPLKFPERWRDHKRSSRSRWKWDNLQHILLTWQKHDIAAHTLWSLVSSCRYRRILWWPWLYIWLGDMSVCCIQISSRIVYWHSSWLAKSKQSIEQWEKSICQSDQKFRAWSINESNEL